MIQSPQEALKQHFGYDAFRPGQAETIEAVLGGQDALAILPTGVGKSVIYQVPALVTGKRCLVVSPLIALIEDQVANLRGLGIGASKLHGNMERAEQVDGWRKFQAGESLFLYLTPERLMTARMRDALQRLDIGFIAVDEAHCVLKWGMSFRPEYLELGHLRYHFPDSRMIGLTATATPKDQRAIADSLLRDGAFRFAATNIRQNFNIQVKQRIESDWKAQLFDTLDHHTGQSGIVYCSTRKECEEVVLLVKGRSAKVAAYHAGLEPYVRQQVYEAFLTGAIDVICATTAFGMGVDKPDIRFVFHRSMPRSLDDYFQEIGRAGRDGKTVHALLMADDFDHFRYKRFIDQEDFSPEEHKLAMAKLDQMYAFAITDQCRLIHLADHFLGRDHHNQAGCGNCDLCQAPQAAMVFDPEALDTLFELVMETGERFGSKRIVDILRGKPPKDFERQYPAASHLVGAGRDLDEKAWKRLLYRAQFMGLMEVVGDYHSLVITNKGWLYHRRYC